MMRCTRLLLALGLLLSAADGAAAQSTAVIVVRHAETTGEGRDPVLSETGAARAQALADALVHAGVTAIYTSQYRRTQLTAAPLAAQLGITSVVIPAGNPMQAHVDSIAAAVKRNAGGTVLVTGHSNTVPMIVRALGGPDVGPIAETDYHNFFTLILEGDSVRMVRSRY